LEVGFFTFFSLTEHVVFALQAIPIALPTAASILGILVGYFWGYQDSKRQTEDLLGKLPSMSLGEKHSLIADLEKRAARYKALDPYIRFGTALTVLILLAAHAFTSAYVLAAILIALLCSPEQLQLRYVQYAVIAFLIASGWMLAALIGLERAETVLSGKTPSERITVDGTESPTKLIRAGERGVLFVAMDKNKVTFVRWEQIKRIESF
jgi:hypothetical protein